MFTSYLDNVIFTTKTVKATQQRAEWHPNTADGKLQSRTRILRAFVTLSDANVTSNMDQQAAYLLTVCGAAVE